MTHKKVFANLDFIKNSGMGRFIGQQKSRMTILMDFLANYDDGRSKSFYCIGCALLPLAELQESCRFMDSLGDVRVGKEKNKRLKEKLQGIADQLKIDLKLNKKK